MSIPIEQLRRQAQEDAALALQEDVGPGDLSGAVAGALDRGRAEVVCRDGGVLCGRLWFESCFLQPDPAMQFDWQVEEGMQMEPGQVVVRLEGLTRALLAAERPALNLLQTLSGTATAARELCRQLQERAPGKTLELLDTRKTLPLLRLAQKHATAVGGMTNHRLGLWDRAMVKENHIVAAGSLERAVEKVRKACPDADLVVEITDLQQLDAALEAGVEQILLDNMDDGDIAEAVRRAGGKCYMEVSGGVGIERFAELAAIGVDGVSVGAVTKHLKAVDFSLLLTD